MELANDTQEAIKNRKNSSSSLRTISSSNTVDENFINATNNNNNSTNNNYNLINGNSDEISTSSTESNLVSKIVGKFTLDTAGITSTNTLFANSTFIKPNGVTYKVATSPTAIIPFNSLWNEKKESNNNNNQPEVMDQ